MNITIAVEFKVGGIKQNLMWEESKSVSLTVCEQKQTQHVTKAYFCLLQSLGHAQWKKSSLLKLNLEAVLTENYEAVCRLCWALVP